jgi:hypothetical protein
MLWSCCDHVCTQSSAYKAQTSKLLSKAPVGLTYKRLPANHSDNFVVLILAHGTYPFIIIIIIIISIILFFFILSYGTYPFIIIIIIFSNFQNLMQRVQHQAYQVEREPRSFIVCADFQRDISPPDHAGQFVKDVPFFFLILGFQGCAVIRNCTKPLAGIREVPSVDDHGSQISSTWFRV